MRNRLIFIIVLLLALSALPQMAQAQQTLTVPTVYVSSGLTVGWSAGTVNNGGHPVTVTAGTGNTTAAETDCSAPNYSLCNFVYSNSSGTVSITTTPATAFGSGNSLLAAIETGATTVTQIVYPWQMFSVYGGSFPVLRGVTANFGIAGTSAGNVVFSNATSGSITMAPPTGALGTVTVTVPAATDTLVGKATTDTLTNKTLTTPVISSISNTGTVTLPTNTGAVPTGYSCGNALAANGACANTAQGGTFHVVFGSAVLGSNTSTITAISPAFTSTTTAWCIGQDTTTRANPVQVVVASSSTITITNTTGASDTVSYICFGN